METTLTRILLLDPPWAVWKKLLSHLRKSGIDQEPLDFMKILDGIGVCDTLWILDRVEHGSRLQRRAKAAFAAQVLPIFERECPEESAPRRAIESALDDDAAPKDRDAFALAAEAAGEALGVLRSRLKEVGPWWSGARAPALAAWAAADAARQDSGVARVANGVADAWVASVGGPFQPYQRENYAQEAHDFARKTQDNILRGLLKVDGLQ